MSFTSDPSPRADILVVDDTPENLRLLVKILREKSYKVRPVPNGQLALSAIAASPPDLVLLDVMMPGMNGYQVCEILKSQPHTQSIPIVFITAMNEVLDKVKGFSLGAVDYIIKPFEIEEVLVRVHTHLENSLLQKRLQEKNIELELALDQLKQTQNQLIQSEKMAILGQLMAGIAHEINTPLGAIRASADNMSNFFNYTLEKIPDFFHNLKEPEREFFRKISDRVPEGDIHLSSREKRACRRQLTKQLTAGCVTSPDSIADSLVDIGICEEIDEIVPQLQEDENRHILDMVYQISSIRKSFKTILTATERAAKVVIALKRYARQDLTSHKELAQVELGLDTALTLYQNKFKHGIEIVKNYEPVPPIWCYVDELNQVWTNLINNAMQAMNYKGTITIDLFQVGDRITVKIKDTGSGIKPEHMPQIFEVFFTTKSPGEGSGLGLDIVKKIIDKHQGTIEVKSVPGNTEFTVTLPIVKLEVNS
ncbi:response regulator [Roseofilum sp. BLCC_M143]|uniref:histidine kinase n=2 Tax=Roseofilum TaxID=1233426 RepID=A0ABT7BZX5_9CYAN|nr:response regulator [Roseofilum casamattae BLCC-M143]